MLHHAKADFIFMNFLMTIFANIKEVTKYALTFDIISFVGFSCNIMGSGPYPILNSELSISFPGF